MTVGVIRAAEVTATLDPAQVAVGESAELTVTVNGSSTSAPYLPEIAGLDIEHVGQATQVQIINGAMSASSVHTYQIARSRDGIVSSHHAGTANEHKCR